MVNFVILNEMSFPLPKEEDKIGNILKNFQQISKKLRENNIIIIRSTKNLNEIEIALGEYLSEFIGTIRDPDLKRIAKSIFVNSIIEIKSPLYTREEAKKNNLGLIEYKYNNQIVFGFGAGEIFDTIVISFLTSKEWDNPIIKVHKDSMEISGDIKQEELDIKHSSTLENLLYHDDFLKILANEKYNICKEEFWSRKDEIFKKIKFCNEIEDQIRSLSNEVYMAFINKLKLVELGLKNIESWNFSPESERTMKEYRDDRIFSHDDFDKGNTVFENHIKSFPDGNRMYFLKREEFIYIGYIGKHLKTAKHK